MPHPWDILKNTGVAFNDDEALDIFKKKTDTGWKGPRYFLRNPTSKRPLKQPQNVSQSMPGTLKKMLRSVKMILSFCLDMVLPSSLTAKGINARPPCEDYDNFCKLIQTSKFINMNGWMMVEPADMPHETVHLDLNLSNMLLCDKPFMGSPVSRQGALDGIEMAGILWGGKENIMDKTVSVSLINSLSPLQFSDEMAGALIELVRHGQACVVASLIMAGGSGPVTLDGVLALQNAEILAGDYPGAAGTPGRSCGLWVHFLRHGYENRCSVHRRPRAF